MAISAEYSKEIRKNLSYFPCWEPGDSVSPGDVGELDHGVFIRQTTLRDVFPDLPLVIERDAKPNSEIFQSENSVSVQFKQAGSVPGVNIAGAKASVEITFSRSGAVVFHATNCGRRFIRNLRETREYVARNRISWPKGHAFVSHVEEAESFAVFVSSADGGWVNLNGKLDMLQQFKLTEGSVTVVNSHNIGYQRIGSGPVLLRLYGPGFVTGIKLLAGGKEQPKGLETEVPELSPRASAFD